MRLEHPSARQRGAYRLASKRSGAVEGDDAHIALFLLPSPGAEMIASARPSRGDIAVVLGTRPEIIKLAPVVRALGERARLIWTGQHFDPNLADLHFAGVGLPMPVEQLRGVGGERRGEQVVAVLSGLMRHLEHDPPRVVVVQGDTNTTNASAQAAHYSRIPVVHVEAGLRSWDRDMPEEINRMIVGAVADLHCCPTEGNAEHLRAAGVANSAIAVTGNPIVEATAAMVPDREAQRTLLSSYSLEDGGFVLTTLHRPENVDGRDQLATVLAELGRLPWPVVFPVHPRTAARIEQFGLGGLAGQLLLISPIDHRSFLGLMARARLVVSDSGGVQEEVTVLKKPLVVVRVSTERPEAIAAGFAVMATAADLGTAAAVMGRPEVAARLSAVPCPFGDGHAGERIAAVICALADRAANGEAVSTLA